MPTKKKKATPRKKRTTIADVLDVVGDLAKTVKKSNEQINKRFEKLEQAAMPPHPQHVEQQKKDIAKQYRPQQQGSKTYFYQKPDGDIFCCNETEAFHIHKWYRQIGVSDGTTYKKIMAEIVTEEKTLDKKIQTIDVELDQLLNSDDAKSQKQFDFKMKNMEMLIKKRKRLHEEQSKKAFDAELNVAYGNLELPPDKRGIILERTGQGFAEVPASSSAAGLVKSMVNR